MQKFIVYGAGRIGKYIVYKSIEQGFKDSVIAVYDMKLKDFDLKENHVVVKNPMFLDDERRDENIIVAIEDVFMAQDIVIALRRKGFVNIYIVDVNMILGTMNPLNENGDFSIWIRKYYDVKPVLPVIDYQVVDECNLNCKACFHHTNSGIDKHAEGIEVYSSSLKYIKKSFRNIHYIRLMGGEPLLAENLDEYLDISRLLFPESHIDIITNGILVRQMSSDLLQSIKRNNVKVAITQYPVLTKQEQNILFLRDNEINYSLSPLCDTFDVSLSRNEQKVETAFSNCVNKYDYFLRNKKLSACARMQMAFEKKEKLGLWYTDEEFIESTVDLVDENSGWDILEKLSEPTKMCKYCSKYKSIRWEILEDKNDISAYFVD